MNNLKTVEATQSVAEFNQFDSELAEFKNTYEGRVYDLADKKQEKQARSDKYAIGKVLSKLDKTHKELKEPIVKELNAKIGILDSERKRIKDDLKGIQDAIKGQIEKHEEAIRVEAAELQERIDSIKNTSSFAGELKVKSGTIQARIDKLICLKIDDSFADRKGDAALAKDGALNELKSYLESVVDAEAAEKESEKVRIEQMKADAEAKAKADAKAAIAEAEQRAKDAEAKLLMDASEKEAKAIEEAETHKFKSQQAKERAERDAKQAVINQEAAVKAAKLKAESEQAAKEKAEADALKAREADKAHKAEVNQKAIEALCNWGVNVMTAKNVIEIIAKNAVPNVKINY